ncbi:MAG: hypothetical protein V1722_00145 [Candidatus Micrarchaeota archaeon]
MPAKIEWKTASEVKRLVVSDKEIGQGAFGTVYHGRIWFKGKKPLRVAVKKFHPGWQVTDEVIRAYRQTLENLRRVGAPMPKVGFVKHEGNWVQVSAVYGATARGSKFEPILQFQPRRGNPTGFKMNSALKAHFNKEKNRRELLDVIAKITNAGILPAPDSINVVPTKTGKKIMVTDFDFYGMHFEKDRELTPDYSNHLTNWLHNVPGNLEENIKLLKSKLTNEHAIKVLEKMERKTAAK